MRHFGPVRWLGLLAGLVLLADALLLMAHGMFNLGVTLPAALGLVFVTSSGCHAGISRVLRRNARLRRLWWLGWTAFGLWLVSLLIFWAQLLLQARQPSALPPLQAIVVLGSATRDGQPSPTLALRLDRAAQLAAQHPQALVVTSGGVDFGEKESEGAVMARYLHDHHGLEAGRLVREERSTSTELNLAWSQPLLRARGVATDAPIAIVTSDFHTLRAGWIARRHGYQQGITVGAATPLSIRPNAWLREYFAVLSGWLLGEF